MFCLCPYVHSQDNLISYEWILTKLVIDCHQNITLISIWGHSEECKVKYGDVSKMCSLRALVILVLLQEF